MMRCEDVTALLEAYQDGECTDAARRDVSSHIQTCDACRQTFDESRTIAQHIFSSTTVPTPPFLWTRVLAGIEAEEALRAAPWWLEWRWMTRITVTASLLVGLGSFYLYKQSAVPLEVALEGGAPQQEAIQVASAVGSTDETASTIVEGESWAVN